MVANDYKRGINMWQFNRDRLIALREAKGLTSDEIASAIGTSKQHVLLWESGELVPSTKTLVKIANAFSVSPLYFFTQNCNQNCSNTAKS
jgi:transcriptional regulator with XRE-family HTH domain